MKSENHYEPFTGLRTLKRNLRIEFENRTMHIFRRFKGSEYAERIIMESQCTRCEKRLTVVLDKYEVYSDWWIRVFSYRILANGVYEPCSSGGKVKKRKTKLILH